MKKKNSCFEQNKLKYYALLFLLLIAGTAGAQLMNIRGSVLDSKTKEPLIGVSILVKGTTNGVSTDADGHFAISQVKQNSTLTISYIGYISQEIQVTSATSALNILLKEDLQILDEVVVVGFGVQKKVNLTGSVGVATSKDIESRPVANAELALQGIVPGLNISNQGKGGELNNTKSINIRGVGTIDDQVSGSPLILIDGMEGNLTQVNPQDIENISVLKDAAAASIYGSRAPYGVVLITTKSGKKATRTSVNYNNSFRVQTPVKLPSMQNSYEFINYFRDAFMNGNDTKYNNASYIQKVKDYMDGKLDSNDVVWSADGTGMASTGRWNYDYTNANVDWVKEYYKGTSPSMEHNISVSGGTDKATYYVSGNYMAQDGFMRHGTDTYGRYALSGKINMQVSKDIEIGYSTRFVRTKYTRPTIMNDSFYENIMRRARPVRAIKDPNGYYMADINYAQSLQSGGRHREDQDMNSHQLKLVVTPLTDWKITAEMNMRLNNDWTHYDQNLQYAHYSGLGSQSEQETYLSTNTGFSESGVSEYSGKYTYLNPTIYSSYSKKFTEKHHFTFLVGAQIEEQKKKNSESISGRKNCR